MIYIINNEFVGEPPDHLNWHDWSQNVCNTQTVSNVVIMSKETMAEIRKELSDEMWRKFLNDPDVMACSRNNIVEKQK